MNFLIKIINIDAPFVYALRGIVAFVYLLSHLVSERELGGVFWLCLLLIFCIFGFTFYIVVGIFSKKTHIRIQKNTLTYSQNILRTTQQSITFNFERIYTKIKWFTIFNLVAPFFIISFLFANDTFGSHWSYVFLIWVFGFIAIGYIENLIIFHGGTKKRDTILSLNQGLSRAGDMFVGSLVIGLVLGGMEILGRYIPHF